MVRPGAVLRQKRDLARIAGWIALLLVLIELAAGTPSLASPGTGASRDVAPAVLKSDLALISAPAKAIRLFDPCAGSGSDHSTILDEAVDLPEGTAAQTATSRAAGGRAMVALSALEEPD